MSPFHIVAWAGAALSGVGLAACTGLVPRTDRPPAPTVFYTLTGEMALSRHEPRVAALQYAAAVRGDHTRALLERATDVTQTCLQPSLTVAVAQQWAETDPSALEAHQAIARASLELHHTAESAAQYRWVLGQSPRGTEAEFVGVDADLESADDIYGARQVADRLALDFPTSPAALRLQALAALRADDPEAAMRAFQAALALPQREAAAERELTRGYWRAQILAGRAEEPLRLAKAALDEDPSAENRVDYTLLLLAAQRLTPAREQLTLLTGDADARPVALRLLGLMDFQDGDLAMAGSRFAELVTTGKFLDDALYYLGLIAERHGDVERALRLFAEVRRGDNAVPALLHAASLLRTHGAAAAADELLDALLEEVPQRAPAIWAARARIEADAGDMAGAQRQLATAEEQYPDSDELRYAEAALWDRAGNTGASLHVLLTLMQRRPDDPAALNAYGYTLADHGQKLTLARRLIEQAHAAAPINPAILDSLGWVLFRQGRGAAALPYLNAAYAADRDGDVAAHLGEVLWSVGRRDEAQALFTEASKDGSDNRLLKSTILRLKIPN